MALVDNLLAAMVRHDAEALVLHIGEKPYIVTATGNVELATRELTFEIVMPMLEQLLSATSQSQLEEFGAVQDDLQTPVASPGDRFTVVAARGGEDIWVELRRHRPLPQPAEVEEAIEAVSVEAPPAAVDVPGVAEIRHVSEVADAAGEAAVAAPEPEAVESLPEPEPAEPIELVEPVEPAERVELVEPVEDETAALPAVVLPMRPRSVDRPPDRAPRAGGDEGSELERLLSIAASRRATTLYAVTDSKPLVRVEGEIRPLDMERTLTSDDVESLVLAMMPEGDREALRRGTEVDWVRDLPEVGSVRCTRFRDQHGPGAIFQLIGARALSADELGLPRGVRELAAETEGLILIAGPRASGKSTLMAAVVDLINRTRAAHIITLESQIKFAHQSRASIVSQREVRGDHAALLAMARTALREGPDVLAIEDLRARDVFGLALQAAESGHLVLGAVPASSAAAAIERILSRVSDERRSALRRTVSDTLRGVIAQVLLRKIGGGRVAAREILRNTPAVATVIAEGNLAQLASAIERGRRAGMISLNESLLDLVREKTVDVQEAYRHAADRDGLVKLLEKEGIDTSFVERMA